MKAITRAVDEALDEWYAKGYNDGLEAACRTDNRTLCKCVSIDRFDKYDERNRIHVGDEVIFDDGEKAFVIKIYAETHYVTVVCSDGCTKYCAIDRIKKTGNHFAEVSKLLEKLRGEE